VHCSEIQQQLQEKVETLRKQWTTFMPHLAIIQVCTFLEHDTTTQFLCKLYTVMHLILCAVLI